MYTKSLPSTVTATKWGLCYEDCVVIPIQLTKCTRILNFSADSSPHEHFHLEYRIVTSHFAEKSKDEDPVLFASEFSILYDPKAADKTIAELKRLGVMRPNQRNYLATYVLINAVKHLTRKWKCPESFISSHSGWICQDDKWLYLTSNYAIGADGVHPEHHCESSVSYLKTDKRLGAHAAFLATWKFLLQDFSATVPILCTALSSCLTPLREIYNLPPFPGLLIGGNPGSGKTQLATHLARFLTDSSGDLNDVFILQGSSRKFSEKTHGLKDCSFILDDWRITGSQAITQAAKTVLERAVHSSFQGVNGAPLLIITGELNAFAQISESSMSRMLQIFLEPSENRRALIRDLNKNPLVVRTFCFHFIQFLAKAFSDNSLAEIVHENEKIFNRYFPLTANSDARLCDNFSSSLLAFRCFLFWGFQLKALSQDQVNQFTEKYCAVLRKIVPLQKSSAPTHQCILILTEIIRNLQIHIAVKGNYRYRRSPDQVLFPEFCDTYGHHVILDTQRGYSGILLKEPKYIFGIEHSASTDCLLLVSYDDFCTEFEKVSKAALHLNVAVTGCKNKSSFFKVLRKHRILMGRNRHDPSRSNGVNYKLLGYPVFKDNQILCNGSILILKLDTAILQNVFDSIQEREQKLISEQRKHLKCGECLFYETGIYVSQSDLEKCAKVVKSVF